MSDEFARFWQERCARKARPAAMLLALGATLGATGTPPARPTVSARVAAVRAELSKQQTPLAQHAATPENTAPKQIAQWLNWGNWVNWANFSNWANWANFANWFNT